MTAPALSHAARDESARARNPGSIWHIVTGEYPPIMGGVADYTFLAAKELVGRGREVHVWTTPAVDAATQSPEISGVVVHRLADCWSRRGLTRLGRELDGFSQPRRLLVQYTPQSWGFRGINLGFCRWVAGRHKLGDAVDVMFHEVAYSYELGHSPIRRILAAVHSLMARTIVKGSDRLFVSIPSWETMLRGRGLEKNRAAKWLPVPSNVPVIDDPAAVAEIKRRIAPGGETIVGHFGTFGGLITPLLTEPLPPLLEGRSDRVGLLLGRGGRRFAEELTALRPALAGRLSATGGLTPEALSLHLQACDLMVQPFPDGASTRRGSLMAALAHGLPVATTSGHLSETIWSELDCLVQSPAGDAPALVAEVEKLIADPVRRAELGAKARAVADERFSIRNVVDALLLQDEIGRPGGKSLADAIGHTSR